MAVAFVVCTLLPAAGCGQTGALTLPERDQVEQAPAPDVEEDDEDQ